jgi:hypothetical protein
MAEEQGSLQHDLAFYLASLLLNGKYLLQKFSSIFLFMRDFGNSISTLT